MEKNQFFRAKILSVNTWRSGPDICSLICGLDFPEFKLRLFLEKNNWETWSSPWKFETVLPLHLMTTYINVKGLRKWVGRIDRTVYGNTGCSKQFKWTYTLMCLGRVGRFGQCWNCSKIQIWNLDRLTHIQFNVWGNE